MKNQIFLTLILIFLLSNAWSQWSQTKGPTGGGIISLVSNGTNLFAATTLDGIFVSTNDGANWYSCSGYLPSKNILSLAVNGNCLVAVIHSGQLYRSSDNGTSWNNIYSGLPASGTNSVFMYGSRIYAATDRGLYISTNSGYTWYLPNHGSGINEISACGVHAGTIFTGGSDSIFRTTNSGTTWDTVFVQNNKYYFCFNIAGNNIYAGTNMGIVYSSDNGNTWSNMSGTGFDYDCVYSIAFSGSRLFAGTRKGVFMSPDSGNTWQNFNKGLTDSVVNSIVIKGSNLFAATIGSGDYQHGGGIFISSDNGTTWNSSSQGIINSKINVLAVKDNNLFAGANNGLFVSSDFGETWNNIPGLWSNDINALCVTDSLIFAGTRLGLHKVRNTGTGWSVSHLLSADPIFSLLNIGDKIISGGEGIIYIYSIANNTFQTVGIPNYNCLPVSDGCHINSFIEYGHNIFSVIGDNSNCGLLYCSSDGGSSWYQIYYNSPSTIFTLESAGNHLIGGTHGDGLIFSADTGKSWTVSESFLVNENIQTFYSNGGNIFVGTKENGVYWSSDDGNIWRGLNAGLDDKTIRCFTICGNFVFAGSDHGVWKRSLSQVYGINSLNDSKNSVSIYPNPSSDKVTIEIKNWNIYHNLSLTIFNIYGEQILVKAMKASKTDLDISNLSSGFYLFKIKGSFGSKDIKFVKY